MVSMRLALAAASMVSVTFAQLGQMVDKGCFKSATGLKLEATDAANTMAFCGPVCAEKKNLVFALNDLQCWCGDVLPPTDAQTEDSECDTPCPGYPDENCGGTARWRVRLSGYNNNNQEVENAPSESSSSSEDSSTPGSSTAPPTVVTTAPGSTVTQAPAATSQASQPKSNNTVGIAVGVVVGVVAMGAILAAIFFILRRRKQRELLEDRRRHADMTAFTRPLGTSGGSSVTDNRLDPDLSGRRNSAGSIADDQDYSRRILQVRN